MKVWKKEFSPCEGELSALRRGEEWDPVSDYYVYFTEKILDGIGEHNLCCSRTF